MGKHSLGPAMHLACGVALFGVLLLLPGCVQRPGGSNPREAALAWSEALVGRDYATVRRYTYSESPSNAQIDAARVALGPSTDVTGVAAVVVGESTHYLTSEVDIAFRQRGGAVRERLPIMLMRTEGGWLVVGLSSPPTAAQEQNIKIIVNDYLLALASNDSSSEAWLRGQHPVHFGPARVSALGPYAQKPITEFKVQSVTAERVFQGNNWWATAWVGLVDSGQRRVFPVRLSGKLPPSTVGTMPEVTDALFGTSPP